MTGLELLQLVPYGHHSEREITDQTPLAVQSWLSIGILYCNIFVFSGNELGKEFWKRSGWSERSDIQIMQRPTAR